VFVFLGRVGCTCVILFYLFISIFVSLYIDPPRKSHTKDDSNHFNDVRARGNGAANTPLLTAAAGGNVGNGSSAKMNQPTTATTVPNMSNANNNNKRFGLTRSSAKHAISKLTGNGINNGGGAKVTRRSSTEHKLYEGTIRGPKIAHESKFVEQSRLKAQQRANSVLKKNKNMKNNYHSDKVSNVGGGIVLSENTPPERTGFDLFFEAKKKEWEREVMSIIYYCYCMTFT
jgi:hypothetical protein